MNTYTYIEVPTSVRDSEGGTWYPGPDAMDEIKASEDPEATALRICDQAPMRGTWKS